MGSWPFRKNCGAGREGGGEREGEREMKRERERELPECKEGPEPQGQGFVQLSGKEQRVKEKG